MRDKTWEVAIEWVDSKRRVIAAHVRRYQVHTSYDLDDYVQQAYLTAYDTLTKLGSTGKKFEQHFWVTFKHDCFKVSISPDIKGLTNAMLVSGAQKTGDPAPLAAARRLVKQMSPRERDVWELVLDGAYTSKEIRDVFGFSSHHHVKKLKRNGLERVRRSTAGIKPEVSKDAAP